MAPDARDINPDCRDREPLLDRLGHGVIAQPNERRRICRGSSEVGVGGCGWVGVDVGVVVQWLIGMGVGGGGEGIARHMHA